MLVNSKQYSLDVPCRTIFNSCDTRCKVQAMHMQWWSQYCLWYSWERYLNCQQPWPQRFWYYPSKSTNISVFILATSISYFVWKRIHTVLLIVHCKISYLQRFLLQPLILQSQAPSSIDSPLFYFTTFQWANICVHYNWC